MANLLQKPVVNTKVRIGLILILMIPIFLAISLSSKKTFEARSSDFAAYWQAGHMILSNQDIYNSQEWTTERSLHGTALHSEPTFQYPLPFAILMAPLGFLSVEQAYNLWVFIGEIAILITTIILITFYTKRPMIFEILVIESAFLFRPSFVIIFSGQILAEILLTIAFSIYLFSKEKWFFGGLILCLTLFKPSLGVPFLILLGIWFLSKKKWNAIIGITTGSIVLWSIGGLYNFNWVIEYLTIGSYSADKYLGMQPTLSGLSGLFFKTSIWKAISGIMGFCIVLVFTEYFVIGREIKNNPYLLIATLIPATLLIAPYSWNYDQFLLIIPIVYIMMVLSAKRGVTTAALFSHTIIGFAIILALVANNLGYDIWSILIPGLIWIIMLFIQRFDSVSDV